MQPRRLALLCTVLAFICFGSSNTQSVYQAANVMSTQVGESVTLDCKITVSYTYYNMYWYRQLSSGEMTHIIRLYSANRNSREGRYSVVFQKPTLMLTISALTPGDSAVYFCAVAQASHRSSMAQKVTQAQTRMTRQEGEAVTMDCKFEPSDAKTTQPNAMESTEGESVRLPCNHSTISGGHLERHHCVLLHHERGTLGQMGLHLCNISLVGEAKQQQPSKEATAQE
ncbi:T cell receptor alpha chain MC.7.G5-like [Equus quagga]|uniref:T cell receptor alpha chain MC.7.G5-like n=1 Tax=Equus quagga TaxID=89248 RepID=UPI001EE31946|nr:T cell receptor alpha chain MC.7.G5-like [Equus quagga]